MIVGATGFFRCLNGATLTRFLTRVEVGKCFVRPRALPSTETKPIKK